MMRAGINFGCDGIEWMSFSFLPGDHKRSCCTFSFWIKFLQVVWLIYYTDFSTMGWVLIYIYSLLRTPGISYLLVFIVTWQAIYLPSFLLLLECFGGVIVCVLKG